MYIKWMYNSLYWVPALYMCVELSPCGIHRAQSNHWRLYGYILRRSRFFICNYFHVLLAGQNLQLSEWVKQEMSISTSAHWLKALAHYNWNCKKVVIVRTHYNFFSQLQRFFQQFHIWTTIFTKVKIFVVCEGLKLRKLFPNIWKQKIYWKRSLIQFRFIKNRSNKLCVPYQSSITLITNTVVLVDPHQLHQNM